MKAFLLLIIFLFPGISGVAQKQSRPNILWIICEDMSQDLSCYGNDLVQTPTIDKLAK